MPFRDPFSRVAVAFDGSPPSKAALRFALNAAEQFGGEAVVVNASDTLLPATLALRSSGASSDAQCRSALVAALDPYRRDLYDWAARAAAPCRVPVGMEFATNTAVAAILDAAARWNASAIAIGTHGRSTLPRTVIGSTADAVARRSALPVAILRDRVPAAARGIRRLIVGIDSGRPSTDALDYAIALARQGFVHVVLVAVVDPEPALDTLRIDARDALDASIDYARAFGLYPDTSIVEGDVPSGLLKAAEMHRADAIVLGAHERGLLDRVFFSGIGEATARRSTVPVVIVPTAAAVEAAPAAPSYVEEGMR